MKNDLLKILSLEVLLIVLTTNSSFSQTTIQISASRMTNAIVGSLDPTTNYEGYPEFDAIGWTNGGTPFISRSLVSYDLSLIPPGSIIVSATLSLYGDSSTSNYQGSAGSNACYLQLINSAWDANTATWDNQPTADTIDEVTIPQSTSIYENYPDINITKLISDLYNNPSTYFGLRLILQDETQYNSMVFGSNTNSDTSIRPKLVITYVSSGTNYACDALKGPKYTSGAFFGSLDPNDNYADYPEFDAIAWTNGSSFIARSIIEFNLSSIPKNATIYSATLSLFGDSTTSNFQGDAGSNATYLKRVTSNWSIDAITWNNQPTTTDTDEILIPQSTSQYEDYPDIDITPLINDIYHSSYNYGLMLQLQNEEIYTSTVFGSEYNSDSTIWPVLQICYTTPSAVQVINTNEFNWNIYPNPFDDFFTVSYNLTQAASVSFELYNIIGQKVAEANIGEEDAGIYHYSLNPGQDLPSGVYMVKVLINSNVINEKIIKD